MYYAAAALQGKTPSAMYYEHKRSRYAHRKTAVRSNRELLSDLEKDCRRELRKLAAQAGEAEAEAADEKVAEKKVAWLGVVWCGVACRGLVCLLTTYYLLLYYVLLTTYYLLLTTYYLLRTLPTISTTPHFLPFLPLLTRNPLHPKEALTHSKEA